MLALPLQARDPRLRRTHALTQGLDLEPCPYLTLSCEFQSFEQPISRGGIEHGTRRGDRVVQRRLRRLGLGLGLGDGGLRLCEPRLEALALGDSGFVAHRDAVDLLGVGGQSRIVLPKCPQRVLGLTSGRLDRLVRLLARFAE